MENKFMEFWNKWGPAFLVGTGIIQIVVFNDFAVAFLFFLLAGLILIEREDNDK